jgi:hypothetical protein
MSHETPATLKAWAVVVVMVMAFFAACSSGSDAPVRVAQPPAEVTVVPTVVVTATPEPGTPTSVPPTAGVAESPVDRQAVLQEHIELRNTGQMLASVELATVDLAEEYRGRLGGLEAWNFRSEQAEPCKEYSPGNFLCDMLERTDFHAVGGFGPWNDRMTVKINEAGIITQTSHQTNTAVNGIAVFNRSFRSWLADAHPDEAEKMNVLMGPNFTAEDALIALQYVEEFVAQSEDYPVEATSSG